MSEHESSVEAARDHAAEALRLAERSRTPQMVRRFIEALFGGAR